MSKSPYCRLAGVIKMAIVRCLVRCSPIEKTARMLCRHHHHQQQQQQQQTLSSKSHHYSLNRVSLVGFCFLVDILLVCLLLLSAAHTHSEPKALDYSLLYLQTVLTVLGFLEGLPGNLLSP